MITITLAELDTILNVAGIDPMLVQCKTARGAATPTLQVLTRDEGFRAHWRFATAAGHVLDTERAMEVAMTISIETGARAVVVVRDCQLV